MTWYIHVNINTIRANKKHGRSDPVVRVQKGKYGKSSYWNEVSFKEGKILYSPQEPILPCGARLVITTETEPETL